MGRHLLVLGALFAHTALAQWVPTAGPTGATFHSLAVAGDVVLAASSNGQLFRFDGQWTRTVVGPVREVLAAGSDVFVSDYVSLHRSHDAGLTFTDVPLPSATSLLNLDGGDLFAIAGETLMVSHDDGATWEHRPGQSIVTIALPGQPPVSFPVSLGNHRAAAMEGDVTLVAATAYIFGDVYRLAPGDTAWTPTLFAETSSTDARFISDFVRHGDALYASTSDGVFRTNDGGSTWEEVSAGLAPEHAGAVSDLIAGSSTLFGHFGSAFYRFSGSSWELLPHPPGATFTLADAAGSRLHASLVGDVASLGDAGWEMLPPAPASTPVLMHVDGPTVLAAASGRLHRTDDAGASWTRLPLTGLIGFAHVGPAAILAAVNSASGIARSTDGGATWTPAARPATPPSAGSIVPRRFASDGTASYASYSHQRFGDHGEPLSQYGGVFRTTDGGASWSDVSQGLPVAPLGPQPIGALHAAGATIIAQTLDGSCHRRTGGPWQAMACPSGTIESFGAREGTWFAVSPAGVFRSDDSGGSWIPASSGVVVPSDPNQHALFWRLADLVNTASTMRLFTQYDGVTRGYEFTGTWVETALGFPEGVGWTGFDGAGDTIYGGARDAGVWRLDISTGALGDPPVSFALSAPVPNPAAGGASLTLSLPVATEVTVEVFDGIGRQVAKLHEGRLGGGLHPIHLPTETLAPGVYVVRARAGQELASRTLTVVR